ncbi:MAG: hypothetical protein ABTD50_08680 [Polyangiaceae bacterium]
MLHRTADAGAATRAAGDRRLQILIATGYERSSCNSGLIVANLLARRGHVVRFIAVEDAETRRHVEANGFEYVGVGQERTTRDEWLQAARPLALLRREWTWFERLRSDLDKGIARASADLLFMNLHVSKAAAGVAARAGIPTIALLSNYGSRFDVRWPPVFSSRPARSDSLWSRGLNLLAWAHAWRARRLSPLLRWRRLPELVCLRLIEARERRRAIAHGWRYCYSEWGPRPDLPEVVIGHKALDWPALHRSDRFYLSGSQSLSRRDPDLGWAEGLDDRPIAYSCTSTTYGQNVFTVDGSERLVRWAQHIKRFLDALVEAFARRRDWQLVVACGVFAPMVARDPSPENVRVLRRVPQLDVLARATVGIVQAGSAALRECAYFGVPMLTFAIGGDQLGNAARVEFHRIGRFFDHRRVGAPELIRMIDALATDSEVRSTVRSLSEMCRRQAVHEEAAFAEFVARHTSIAV